MIIRSNLNGVPMYFRFCESQEVFCRVGYLACVGGRAQFAVRLTGPVNPEIGQRYIRDISIGADTPVISFHVVMQNMSGFPQTWSEQTITEYPTSNPAGSENFNAKFWGVTAINPASAYLNGYHVRTGPAENPAFSVSDGRLRAHWNDTMQEVWIDSPPGWLAAVDGMSGYTMVERHHVDRTAEYPSKATIIFYSSGEPVRQNQHTEPREGPFMEAELLLRSTHQSRAAIVLRDQKSAVG